MQSRPEGGIPSENTERIRIIDEQKDILSKLLRENRKDAKILNLASRYRELEITAPQVKDEKIKIQEKEITSSQRPFNNEEFIVVRERKDYWSSYTIYEDGELEYSDNRQAEDGSFEDEREPTEEEIAEITQILKSAKVKSKFEQIDDFINVDSWEQMKKDGWDWLANQPSDQAALTVQDLLKKGYSPSNVATGPSYNLDLESPTGEEKGRKGVYIQTPAESN